MREGVEERECVEAYIRCCFKHCIVLVEIFIKFKNGSYITTSRREREG